MRTILAAAALCAATILALMLLPSLALAADDTAVTVPWGDWVAQILGAVVMSAGTIAVLIITWALKFLPASLKAYVDEQRIKQAEQLLTNAIAYGANAVAGAARGQELNVELGSKVAAQTVQYAVDNGPGWLIKWMGGPEQVLKKVIARLPLTPDATAGAVAAQIKLVPPAAG